MINYFLDVKENYKKLSDFDVDYKWGRTAPQKITKHKLIGSLAYSWTDNGIHFVQLHDNPSYEKEFSDTGFIKAASYHYDIKQSWNWLDKDLTAAVKRGEKIFLLMHDVTDHTFKTTASLLTDLANKFPISGIFAGHNHTTLGLVNTLNGAMGAVPVFKSGAVHYGVGFKLDIDIVNDIYDVEVFDVFPGQTPVPDANKLRIQGSNGAKGTYTFTSLPLH